MTTNKAQKKAVRERMEKTGERYTAARQHLVGAVVDGTVSHGMVAEPSTVDGMSPAPRPIVEQPGLSDEAIRKGSGKSWDEWLDVLDAWGAQDRTHTEIARYVNENFEIDGWYAQGVTVGYERMRGMRAHGQGRDGRYSASVSKTFPVPVAELFAAWTDDAERDRWLEPGILGVRTSQLDTSARFDVADEGSIIAAWFVDKGAAKSSVQLQNDKLPSKEAAEQFKATWKERLACLAEVLNAS